MLNNICIIPARKGSKRCVGKNFKPFTPEGDSLTDIALLAAIELDLLKGCFDKIIVSTDDCDWLTSRMGKPFSDKVNLYPREPYLCSDKISTTEVLGVLVKEYYAGQCNYITLFQPTSPFRRAPEFQVLSDIMEPDTQVTYTTKKDGITPSGNMYIFNVKNDPFNTPFADLDSETHHPADPLQELDIDYDYDFQLAKMHLQQLRVNRYLGYSRFLGFNKGAHACGIG